MKLGNYFLGKIQPAKIVEWVKSKDTNIVEMRVLLYDAKYTYYIENDEYKGRYYDYFKNALDYDDIKKIFDNKRSDLYDLAMNSNNMLLATHLWIYSSESAFLDKVLHERAYLINESIELLEKNIYLSSDQKKFIIDKIKVGVNSKRTSFKTV